MAWRQLFTHGPTPPERERHSAAVVDGKLFVFGGRENRLDDKGKSDLWR